MATAARELLQSLFRSRRTESAHDPNPYDVYFSADVETDGPIPGEFSMLSFALVYAGAFDGSHFDRPRDYGTHFYRELRPISNRFEPEALKVNGLNRDLLIAKGSDPTETMTEAATWVRSLSGKGRPVLVAYPLSFDWSWMYWYFVRFSREGSPFNHSSCFDVKTAFALKAGVPIAAAGQSRVEAALRPHTPHTHHALADAVEQAQLFANIFQWEGVNGRTR